MLFNRGDEAVIGEGPDIGTIVIVYDTYERGGVIIVTVYRPGKPEELSSYFERQLCPVG
jgi:hypothetical protein